MCVLFNESVSCWVFEINHPWCIGLADDIVPYSTSRDSAEFILEQWKEGIEVRKAWRRVNTIFLFFFLPPPLVCGVSKPLFGNWWMGLSCFRTRKFLQWCHLFLPHPSPQSSFLIDEMKCWGSALVEEGNVDEG